MNARRQSIAAKRARQAIHAMIDRWLDAERDHLAARRHLAEPSHEFELFNEALREFRRLTDPPLLLVSEATQPRAAVCVGRRVNRVGCDRHVRIEPGRRFGLEAFAIQSRDRAIVLRSGEWLEARDVVGGLRRYARIPEPPCADPYAPDLLRAAAIVRLF